MDFWESFRSLGIEIKTQLGMDWDHYSKPYNSRVPATPEVVILPETIEQVSHAVRIIAGWRFDIQARSGGHSYASHSNGGVDGSAVIDLRKFQNIDLLEGGVFRVGGGVRLGKLAIAAFAMGHAALAHGTCPAVGVGGHFTNGGFGMLSRAWGLAMDHIIGLDVIMADGRLVRTSNSDNRLIFEVMRGAADSFGIIVNFYLRTQPAPNIVVKWTVNVPEAMRSVKNAVEAFELGSVDEFHSTVLSGLLCCFRNKRGIEVRFHELGWMELLQAMAGDMELNVDSNNAERPCFFAKSAAVAHPGLSRYALEEYFIYLLSNGARAPIDYFVGVQLYGGADSRITAYSINDSFEHRNATWMFQHYGFVKDGSSSTDFPDEGIRFVEGLNRALGLEHGASSNYADPSLDREKAVQLYYGGKLERLIKLKRGLDPRNVFCHPQSIPLRI